VLWIRDVYPGSRIPIYPSLIPDPIIATKERGEKIPFLVATDFTKKFGSVFKELLNFLPKNLTLSS
jgi:hypothetical protein